MSLRGEIKIQRYDICETGAYECDWGDWCKDEDVMELSKLLQQERQAKEELLEGLKDITERLIKHHQNMKEPEALELMDIINAEQLIAKHTEKDKER